MTDNALLTQLNDIADSFVDGTPEAHDTLRNVYPRHLYDPLRRRIAVELAGKEIAKILNAHDNTQLELMRRGVDELYDGRQGVYAPVHDFWSFVEMILHVKKKELPELITAKNVSWTEETLPINDLHLTWMPFLEEHRNVFGDKPWHVRDILRIFAAKPRLRRQAEAEERAVSSEHGHNFDQSDEPIALIDRGNGLELVDGNGRLYTALLSGKTRVACNIGRLSGRTPKDYWVSAGTLKQFCLEVLSYADTDHAGYSSGLEYLRTKLRNNPIALINYQLFLRKDFPDFESAFPGLLHAPD